MRADVTHPLEGPRCALTGERSWPLFDVAQTRAIETAALAAVAPHALMERAGLAVARVLLATQPHARRVHAFAGPGNNGGDALVAAMLLHQRGLRVRVTLLADPARLPADAHRALKQAREHGVAIDTALDVAVDGDVAIDGLLGIGASRAPEGALAQAIRQLNHAHTPTIAIDVPSGLDADRGTPVGDFALHARETLSLLTLKPGLFTAQGRDHAGRIWVDDLRIDWPASPLRLIGAARLEPAPHASHKGSFGDVTVVGGAAGMAGAPMLAARAALAAGAGRIYLCQLDADAPALDCARPELMHRESRDALQPGTLAAQTVVCGCGGGEAVRQVLPPLLTHSARLLLDADALNAIAAEPTLADSVQRRAARQRPTMLTPHPLEAARLLGITARDVQADRLDAARRLAARFDCVVVLKGSGTVVASPNGDLAINPSGNALLASPGTGDVLAGWIGGAWSRRGDEAEPADIAATAVWRHGRAADEAHAANLPNLRAGDLIEAMRQVQLF